MTREVDRPSALWSSVVSSLVLACALLGSATSLPADPPSNDECVGAEVIPGAGPFPYLTSVTEDITDATSFGDPPTPSCAIDDGDSRSIWYSFTPTESGLYSFSTCAQEGLATTVDDTVLGVYTSTASCTSPFAEVYGGCDENGCDGEDLQSTIAGVVLQAETRYDVVAFRLGSDLPAAGDTAVQLKVDRAYPPQNDSCNRPTKLTLDQAVIGTTAHAGDNYHLSGAGCFGGIGQTPSTAHGRDVVYWFVAPSTDEYSFRVTGVIGADPVLYVASACPEGSATLISTCLAAANRSASTTSASEEVLCLGLTAGQTVFVYVDAGAGVSGSTHTIEVSRCLRESETNDAPGTADLLSCPIEGSIAPADESDFFELGTPVAGARIFAMADGAAASSSDFDMRITTELDTLEFDGGGLDVPFGALSPTCDGTPATGVPTYVRVSHASAATISEPYRLYGTVQPPAEDATPETEQNDTIAEADAAASNYFSGALAPADTDVFQVTPQPEPPLPIQAGTLIFAAVDGDPEFDTICTNTKLDLLDSTGAVLLSVDDAEATSTDRAPEIDTLTGSTPTSCSEALVYRVPVSGTYSVRVTGSGGSTGSYLLSIALDCVASCDDGEFCTGNDFVQDGVCVEGPPIDCADEIDCTDDACDGEACVHLPDASNCDDGTVCTIDTCDSEAGCLHEPTPGSCEEESVCTSNAICVDGQCVGTPLDCDDGLYCNGEEGCHPVDGCTPGVPVDCADASGCTIDTCNESTNACVHAPGGCNDGIACTSDVCTTNGLTCVHIPDSTLCQDGAFCNGAEVCLVNQGCAPGPPVVCQDGVSCTVNTCNEVVDSCLTTPDDTLCEDGDLCTINECDPITGCQSSSCDDGNACNGVESCNPLTGCIPGVPPVCNDGNPCNGVETCNSSTGCIPGVPINCSDGNACNGVESCNPSTGCIPGVPPVCNDDNPCTTDACNPIAGCENAGTCCDEIDPWPLGYYRRLCLGVPVPPSEVLTQQDVDCVNDSCTFAPVDSIGDVCAVLLAPIPATACDRAAAELMSLLLNVCRDRLCPRNPIETTCMDDAGTVGDAVSMADGLLCASPIEAECLDIRCALHEINTGIAVGASSLTLERVENLVILSWEEPLHPAGEAVLEYRVQRSAGGLNWETAGSVGADVRTWTDSVESPGIRYYRVTTILQAGGS